VVTERPFGAATITGSSRYSGLLVSVAAGECGGHIQVSGRVLCVVSANLLIWSGPLFSACIHLSVSAKGNVGGDP
jgi:hypothetical protein